MQYRRYLGEVVQVSSNIVGALMMMSSIGAGIIHNFLGIVSWGGIIPIAIMLLFIAGSAEWVSSV